MQLVTVSHQINCAGELADALRTGLEQLQGDWERPKE